MFWLGLRLGLFGRPAAVASSALLATALAAGTAILLFSLGLVQAINERADRDAWTDFSQSLSYGTSSDPVQAATYVNIDRDHYRSEAITLVSLAGSGDRAPLPPGLNRLPNPGEVFVSPALRDLMAKSTILSSRYGSDVGLIGVPGLSGPDSLMAVRGVPLDMVQLSGTAIRAFASEDTGIDFRDPAKLLLGIGMTAVLALTVTLTVVVVRIENADRRRRLAQLRLVGASTRQIRLVAVSEKVAPLSAGVLAGVVLFFLARPVGARAQLDGSSFFVADVMPGGLAWAFAMTTIVGLAIGVSQLDLQAVLAEPDATARRARLARASWLTAVPLVVLLLGVFAITRLSSGSLPGGRTIFILACFAGGLGGLALAGPWLVQQSGRMLARRGGVATLLGGSRLIAEPGASFRAAAGLALALLITTCFGALAPSAYAALSDDRTIGQEQGSAQVSVSDGTMSESASLARVIAAIPGIAHVTSIYEATVNAGDTSGVVWIGDCQEIVDAGQLDGVPCGSAPVLVARNRLAEGLNPERGMEFFNYRTESAVGYNNELLADGGEVIILTTSDYGIMRSNTAVDTPDVIASPSTLGASFADLRPSMLLFQYDDPAAVELARNNALQAVPNSGVATRTTSYDGFNLELRRVKQLVSIAAAVIFGLTGVSLLVMTLSSLVERKRSFAVLRTAGSPLSVLRMAMLLEILVPVLVAGITASLVGGTLGFMLTQSDSSAGFPIEVSIGSLLIGVSVAACIGFIVLMLVGRATRTDETRFE